MTAITAAAARAQPFAFVHLAGTGSGLTNISAPSVNNLGRVAFTANVVATVPGPSGAAIITAGGGGPMRTELTASPNHWAHFTGVSINDFGAIGFAGTRDPGTAGGSVSGAYRLDAAGVATIHELGADEAVYSRPAVNNVGHVAFVQDLGPSTAGGVRPGFGDGAALVFLDTPSPAGYTDVRLASLNHFADPAYVGRFSTPGNPAPLQHLRYRSVEVVPPGAFDEITALDVNDAEQIVFGGVGQGGARVYRTGPAGGTFTPVADGRAVAVAINDHGLLAALFAADGTGPERILFGPSLATPVIAVGDALLGSTVTDLDFVNQGFNDANQIAFLATLADGRGGIYVASPVPEPGVGSLTSSALAMLIRPRRARAGSPRAENPVRDAVTSRTAYPIRTELCAR